MDYMINIDLETKNVSGGATDCQSVLHEDYGRHFDLTVHALECGSRKDGGIYRPPTRYWAAKDVACRPISLTGIETMQTPLPKGEGHGGRANSSPPRRRGCWTI